MLGTIMKANLKFLPALSICQCRRVGVCFQLTRILRLSVCTYDFHPSRFLLLLSTSSNVKVTCFKSSTVEISYNKMIVFKPYDRSYLIFLIFPSSFPELEPWILSVGSQDVSPFLVLQQQNLPIQVLMDYSFNKRHFNILLPNLKSFSVPITCRSKIAINIFHLRNARFRHMHSLFLTEGYIYNLHRTIKTPHYDA